MRKSVYLKSGVCVLVIAMLFAGSAGFAGITNNGVPDEKLSSVPAPEPTAAPGPDETSGWVDDGDFIISYDEPGLYDASNPAIAIAPPGSPWSGSIHAVWSEMSQQAGNPYSEIHYSMSKAGDKGLEWSNDEASEGDREISEIFTGKNQVEGDGQYPSIAIDQQGIIHVVWVQAYPDFTYEIHYSRSTDNGQMWTGADGSGDRVISFRQGNGDGVWISNPRIAVSNTPTTSLHVVWNEVADGADHGEIFYSRSMDGGNTWSGASATEMISDGASNLPSYGADIAIGGPAEDIVHVIWTQDVDHGGGIFSSEVFYTKSTSLGAPGTWEPERPISISQPDETYAFDARIASCDNHAHVVWIQDEVAIGGGVELYYAGSDNDGQDWFAETPVSFPDNDPSSPVIAVSPFSGGKEAHIAWSEYDDASPAGTREIHYSMNYDTSNPSGWTGLDADIVLSSPDDDMTANADYPAIAYGLVNGVPGPQIIWQEKNIGAAGPGKADKNTEIHYIPQTTQARAVSAGWNFMSVALVQNDTGILTVLNDYWGDNGTQWDRALWYDPTDITETLAVTNEHVFGPAAGGEIGPFYLANSDIKNLTLYSDQDGYLVNGQDYTIEWATGEIDISVGLSEMQPGEDLWAFYNYTKQGDPWKSYNKNAPAAQNDLQDIDHSIGFWVNITVPGDGVLTIAGDYPTNTTIDLYAGWNLIGYPALNDTAYTVANLKTDTGATTVMGYDDPSPYDIKTLADSYLLQRGEAYWVRVGGATTWTVSW